MIGMKHVLLLVATIATTVVLKIELDNFFVSATRCHTVESVVQPLLVSTLFAVKSRQRHQVTPSRSSILPFSSSQIPWSLRLSSSSSSSLHYCTNQLTRSQLLSVFISQAKTSRYARTWSTSDTAVAETKKRIRATATRKISTQTSKTILLITETEDAVPQQPYLQDQRLSLTRPKVAFLIASQRTPLLDGTDLNGPDSLRTTTGSVTSKFGISSPYGSPSVHEAVQQLCQKCYYFSDGKVESKVYFVPQNDTLEGNYLSMSDRTKSIQKEQQKQQQEDDLLNANALIAIGLTQQSDLSYASSIFQQRRQQSDSLRTRQCQFYLDGSCNNSTNELFPEFVSLYNSPISLFTISDTVTAIETTIAPWTKASTARRMYTQMKELFGRWTSDDFCYALMIFINQFYSDDLSIDWVKHSIDATWEKGPIRNLQELYSMVDKCGDCIVKCVQDEQCKQCLTKLTEIDSRDQVSSYRTIVSFESELLKDFSQCILTRNNIFNCDATIPRLPVVPPIQLFRNAPITDTIAKQLLIGHLNDETALPGTLQLNVSWIVACGANVAYDQFPSQNQIFYPSSASQSSPNISDTLSIKDMWYDPVFRVNTLDGRSVWCKRHYKVRKTKNMPIGTFRFSVLDNGVTSDEYWTVVGAADDLSWIVFHYAGAAAAVGLQYLGGLLCTPDGRFPTSDKNELEIIWNLFRSAGIQPWELYQVDNRVDTIDAIRAGPPPLDYYRRAVINKRQKREEIQL